MDTLKFFQTLFENVENKIYLFTLPGKKTYQFAPDKLEDMAAKAAQLSDAKQNVYFGLGSTDIKLNSSNRPKNDQIKELPCLFADIDIADVSSHAAKNLPSSISEAMSLLPAPFAPSITVFSGHGLHVYYIFNEPFELPKESAIAKDLLERLQGYIRTNANAHGWHVDTVTDFTRVLRVPDTINYKDPAHPVKCEVMEYSDPISLYNPSDFDFLPPVQIPTARTNPTNNKHGAFERRATDGDVNLMISNCKFLQYWQLNYKKLPEPVWMAACTNLARGVGGEEMVNDAVKDWLGNKYKEQQTIKKIHQWITDNSPRTCDAIQKDFNFDCGADCNVKCPCNWSLQKGPKALAKIRKLTTYTPETIFNDEVIGSLATLERYNPNEFARFKANSKGIINQNDLLKSLKDYKKRQFRVIDGGKSSNNKPITNNKAKTVKDCIADIPLENDIYMPADYILSDAGVVAIKRDADGDIVARYKASYSPIVLRAKVYNLDTGVEKIQIIFKNSIGRYQYACMNKADAYTPRKLVEIANSGVNVTLEMAKYLSGFLSATEYRNGNTLPYLKGVSKMGWRDSKTFILPGQKNNYVIDTSDGTTQVILSGLKTAGSYEKWKAKALDIRTRLKGRFFLAAAFCPPLLKILGQRSFLIHNWDKSQGGKTAMLNFCLSIYGEPEKIKQGFNDTYTNIERRASIMCDLLFGVNELELLKEQQKVSVDQLIYMLAEGRGRGRATKEGLQSTATWRNVGMMTGETQITRNNSRGGIYTRLIEIKAGPFVGEDIFASDLYQFTEENHGFAAREFINKLISADHSQLRSMYRDIRLSLRKNNTDKIESHMDMMACICVADYLASIFIFGMPEKQAADEAYKMVNDIVPLLMTKIDADEGARAWQWLSDWLATNHNNFEYVGAESRIKPREVYGYIDGDDISIIKTVLMHALKANDFNPNKVLNAWADAGKFPCETHGVKRHFGIKASSKLNASRPRVIVVNMENEK